MGTFAPHLRCTLNKTAIATLRQGLAPKLREVAVLFKLRLSALVLVSAALGYLMGVAPGGFSAIDLCVLCASGLLITGASNALNQVLEVVEDSRMERTRERPLVRGALTLRGAVIIALVSATVGAVALWFFLGPLTAILGLLSLVLYVLLYTPLKKHTAWAVFVGAFPGAFPPMLGYVAATGTFGLGPGLLFAGQFVWQFPHFWAIAWLLHDDYARAGYHLLPSPAGRDRSSAFQVLVYTLFLLPVGMLPWAFGFCGPWAMATAVACGLVMLLPAWGLYRTLDRTHARRLMFASFLYLPLVQLAYVLDRL
jgi:heme o synthase